MICILPDRWTSVFEVWIFLKSMIAKSVNVSLKKKPGRRLFLHTFKTFICMGFWKLPPRNLMFKTKIDPPSKYIKTKKEFIISQFNFSTNSRLLELFIAFIGGFTDENFTKKNRLWRIKTVLFWVSWRKDVICISHF